MSGSWACLAWGVFRLVWPSKCLAAGQTDFVGSYWASLAVFGCLAVWWWANCFAGSVLVVGARGEGLKAWVVKLLGGLSASAVHKEL